jgi:hypothetical protein
MKQLLQIAPLIAYLAWIAAAKLFDRWMNERIP